MAKTELFIGLARQMLAFGIKFGMSTQQFTDKDDDDDDDGE